MVVPPSSDKAVAAIPTPSSSMSSADLVESIQSQTISDGPDDTTNNSIVSNDGFNPSNPHPSQSSSSSSSPSKKMHDEEAEIDRDISNSSSSSSNEPLSQQSLRSNKTVPSSSSHHESNEPSDTINSAQTSQNSKRKRLLEDTATKLQRIIDEDPYNINKYYQIIEECQAKSKYDDCRSAYEKLLTVFPTTARFWVEFIEFELSISEFTKAESLFNKSLRFILDVQLWKTYLDYIRRRQNLALNGPQAQQTIIQAYEFTLNHVGIDRDSTSIWKDYIEFLKESSAANKWEVSQKSDQLRKVYHRAVVLPINDLESIWKDYDLFENQQNRGVARKFISARSAAYMTARAAVTELSSMTAHIREPNYVPQRPSWTSSQNKQLKEFKAWIEWEKTNPLDLEKTSAVFDRVQFALKQATMRLRFFPEIWLKASDYFRSQEKALLADETLREGFKANPDCVLLGQRVAELEESKGNYEKMKEIYSALIENIEKAHASKVSEFEERKAEILAVSSESDEAEVVQKRAAEAHKLDEQIAEITETASEKLAMVWNANIAAVRRAEGVKAARPVFAKARASKFATYRIFVISALTEYHCGNDSGIATRIFELGMKKYSQNAQYCLEYLKYLLQINDQVNAKALYEKCSLKLKPEEATDIHKLWLRHQAWFGDFSSSSKVQERLRESDESFKDSIKMATTQWLPLIVPKALSLELGPNYGRRSSRSMSENDIDTNSKLDRDMRGDDDDDNTNSVSSEENLTDDQDGRTLTEDSIKALSEGILDFLGKLPPANLFTGVKFHTLKLMELIESNTNIPASAATTSGNNNHDDDSRTAAASVKRARR